METLLRDVRYALRSLARTPGFTLAVVLTFAIGIGANSAVFSALDAVLLRSLPYRDAERLVSVGHTRARNGPTLVAPMRVADWNELTSEFEGFTGAYAEDVSETSGDLPESVRRATVLPRFLDVLGVQLLLGRGFLDAEQHGTPAAVVMISERFWRTRFNADPNVLEREVRIGSAAARIVGVLPSSVQMPDRTVDLWRPASVDDPFATRDATWYQVVARLKPGVSLDAGLANLRAVQAELARRYPQSDDVVVNAVPFKDTVVGGARASLWLLFGAASAVLLIACANVATLLLTRAGQRRREIAVRLSLGASPWAIVRRSLVETAALAFAGAGGGLLLASGAGQGLRSLLATLPRADEVALSGRVLGYSLAAVVLTTLVAGLLPALRAASGRAGEVLSVAGRGQLTGRQSAHWLLVGVQVALSIALLTSSALLLRSARELALVDPGFEPARVLAFRLSTPYAESSSPVRLRDLVARTLASLEEIPGVDSAAISQATPGIPGRNTFEYSSADGRIAQDASISAAQNPVSGSFFATVGIPLLNGQLCSDEADSGQVLVNQRFVDVYLPGGGPVTGLELSGLSTFAASGRIVGVVANSRETGLNQAPVPTVYQCSIETFGPNYLVRMRGDPAALIAAIRAKLKETEPLRSVFNIAPLDARIDAAFSVNRGRTVLLALFAGVALALACVGIYGTLSYVVSLGRREIGLRLALGALRGKIVREFLWKVLRVVGVACLAGAVLSIASARAVSGMLYGVSPFDPSTLAMVMAVVAGVAALAALLPALRAARIEPMEALRDE